MFRCAARAHVTHPTTRLRRKLASPGRARRGSPCGRFAPAMSLCTLCPMKNKIGIIGQGNVGKAIQAGAQRAGYETRMIGRGGGVKDTAAWADIVVIAVLFEAVRAVAAEIGGAADGKPVVDATNALGKDGLAVGFTTSGAEQLQKALPGAKVVKAFNTVFAQCMNTGRVKGTPAFLPVAADDPKAKEAVLAFARDIGFDAVDAGPLSNARLLEPMAMLLIQLGYVVNKGMGTDMGFSLVR
jgi:predicted dinucleotide-binding enzyme